MDAYHGVPSSYYKETLNSDADSIATGVSSLIDINQVIQDISDEEYQKNMLEAIAISRNYLSESV
jgi:hypothetical protein